LENRGSDPVKVLALDLGSAAVRVVEHDAFGPVAGHASDPGTGRSARLGGGRWGTMA